MPHGGPVIKHQSDKGCALRQAENTFQAYMQDLQFLYDGGNAEHDTSQWQKSVDQVAHGWHLFCLLHPPWVYMAHFIESRRRLYPFFCLQSSRCAVTSWMHKVLQ